MVPRAGPPGPRTSLAGRSSEPSVLCAPPTSSPSLCFPGRAGLTSRAEPPSTHPALLLHPQHSAGPFNFVSCRPEKPRCQRAGSGARRVLSTSESFLLYAALATRRGQRRVRVCVHGCVHVHACVCVCACVPDFYGNIHICNA